MILIERRVRTAPGGVTFLHLQAPKTVLCIHDLSGLGRCSLSVIVPVRAAMGCQPVALPTAIFSTHTGGLGQPAVQLCQGYGEAALEHYRSLGVSFDCIYTGYLASEEDQHLAAKAFYLWPQALKVVDPVMADHGRFYAGMEDKLAGMQALCRSADLILPNLTEASLLLGRPMPEGELSDEAALELAGSLSALCPQAVVTGIPMGRHLSCAGAGRSSFVVRRLKLDRSYPGTGDLFAAVLTGALLFAFGVTCRQYSDSRRSAFETAVTQLQYQWDRYDQLDGDWLARLEAQNGMKVLLTENGAPLLHSLRLGEEERALLEAEGVAFRLDGTVDLEQCLWTPES